MGKYSEFIEFDECLTNYHKAVDSKDHEKIIEYGNKIKNEMPNDIEVLYELAFSHYSISEYNKSLKIIEEILEKDCDYYFASYLKVIIYFEREEYEEVVNLLNEITLVDQPYEAHIYSIWASALNELGNIDDAIIVLEEGIKCFDDVSLVRKLYEIKLTNGEIFEDLFNEKIIKTDEKLLIVYASMTMKYYEENISKAIDMLENYVAENISYEIYITLGNCYNFQQNYLLASENYKSALDLESSNSICASCYIEAYKNVDAIKAKYFALEWMKNNIPCDLFYDVLADIYYKEGDYDIAFMYELKSIKLSPSESDYIVFAVKCLDKLNKQIDGINLINNWKNSYSNYITSDIEINLANMYFKVGLKNKSLEYIEKAFEYYDLEYEIITTTCEILENYKMENELANYIEKWLNFSSQEDVKENKEIYIKLIDIYITNYKYFDALKNSCLLFKSDKKDQDNILRICNILFLLERYESIINFYKYLKDNSFQIKLLEIKLLILDSLLILEKYNTFLLTKNKFLDEMDNLKIDDKILIRSIFLKILSKQEYKIDTESETKNANCEIAKLWFLKKEYKIADEMVPFILSSLDKKSYIDIILRGEKASSALVFIKLYDNDSSNDCIRDYFYTLSYIISNDEINEEKYFNLFYKSNSFLVVKFFKFLIDEKKDKAFVYLEKYINKLDKNILREIYRYLKYRNFNRDNILIKIENIL